MSIFRQLATFATSYVYLSAENFQQEFGAREVCRASQFSRLINDYSIVNVQLQERSG